ncbi:MAG: GNAT family N-acetyltransferase [Proteobacteria bacterium]|nr:GNAT family N-acetyltransferase [Pseudomonadota bacterium]
MATWQTGNDVRQDGESWGTRTQSSRGTSFVTEVFDGADEALSALEVIEHGVASTGFQTLDWLTVLYEELAAAHRALPRLVVVTETESSEVVLALPLLIVRDGALRVAIFADLGVSDYGAPILGPTPSLDAHAVRRMWRSIRAAMHDIDLIRFERMPAEIGGWPNPLLGLFGNAPSRAFGNRLIVEGTFDDYLQSLGKKYRKDVERCYRLWEKEGEPRFYQATTDDAIAHVFATSEEQQAVWHAAHGTKDILADPATRSFYERLAMDGSDAGLTALFALEADGKILATLLGLIHGNVFSLLSISTAGESWSHLSPGRLVVLEAVKHLLPRGVTCFDMGIGSNPLKHGFGTEEVSLYDLVVAQDVTALPLAVMHELSAHLRAGGRLRSAIRKAIPRLNG